MNANILISADTLSELMAHGEPMVIVDTRDPGEFAKGHIPGAVNIRDFFTYLAMSDEAGYEAFREHFTQVLGAAGVDETKLVVVYEDRLNNGFGQSCRGWLILQALGHTHAKVLDGGFQQWLSSGKPVTTAPSTPEPARFKANRAAIQSVFVDKNEMLRALDDHDIHILDIRDQDEWEGISSSPYGKDFAPRKGRLGRSVWVQWDKLMESSARYLPKEYIVSTMRQLGIRPEDTIYIYCFKGARASNTYVALKSAGFENVKVYFGSWNEWSRDNSLPAESEVIQVAPGMA